MTGASDDPDPVVAQAPAGTVVVIAAGSLPATVLLRGTLEATSVPDLEAAFATVAATGRLLVDVCAVDRFDPATWSALVRGCGRAGITGVEFEVTGLRWAQVLDVLAAAPVFEIAASVAAVRALRPGHRHPAAARAHGAVVTPPAPAGTDHLVRDPFRPDPSAASGRGGSW